jgi:hypothetical protein
VVALKKPGALQAGFGDGLATLEGEASVQLLAIGSSPSSRGAAFELGTGETPLIDALDVGHCERQGDERCASLPQPVGLARAQGPDEEYAFCFITGIGQSGDSSGLLVRCEDDTQFVLPVPEQVEREIIEPYLELESLPGVVHLAVDRAEAPAVLAGVPLLGLAFFYSPLSRTPVPLPAAANDLGDSYGNAVAVLRAASDRVFAVAAPESGQVWLFKLQREAAAATPIGCLGGITGFGRALAGGLVDADEFEDLVVSDAHNVTVFSGAVLAELPVTDSTACSLAALPEAGLIASFGCGSTQGVSGCPRSEFGQTLAVGDLDGDGDGEVVVGAPGMTVRGESNAGALIVYDVEGDEPHGFSEVIFASSLEANDRLGSALSTPRLSGRHIVAAGAPGGSKTLLFYCPQMLSLADTGSSVRCR